MLPEKNVYHGIYLFQKVLLIDLRGKEKDSIL